MVIPDIPAVQTFQTRQETVIGKGHNRFLDSKARQRVKLPVRRCLLRWVSVASRGKAEGWHSPGACWYAWLFRSDCVLLLPAVVCRDLCLLMGNLGKAFF